MERVAIFPGSFDPITRGHEDIINRAVPLFDKIIVSIGRNREKKSYFTIDERLGFLKQVFRDNPKIMVDTYEGLTVNYCREIGAKFILRGLRTSADFEFERSIGQVNKKLYPEIETVFLLTHPEFTSLNSSVVRDILTHGGNVDMFVPEGLQMR